MALCLWREARGDGFDGMHAVANVIVNRANKHKTTCDVQVMKPWQFTSMTDPHDPEFTLLPPADDPQWLMAQGLTKAAKASVLEDITKGSTMYYAPLGMTGSNVGAIPVLINGVERPFPKGWGSPDLYQFQVQIGKQLFFTELS